ncbi:response regulator [Zobellia amurskyensis]|uniref:Response regulator n=1 Tax=Zobellia amurskyensis TaxID=248905 RepID=A0A7X2ZXA2_9FLAO|nr:response regulator [Zobellia amurskyensis]MUH38064.1 response regulator [Zobellia amurskyensis]
MVTEQNLLFLVDDDADDRDLFEEAVNQIQIKPEVIAFGDAKQLLEYLEDASHKLPKVIFLDLHLPFISGEDCLIKIRNNKRYNNIHIVIYSTSFVGSMAERLKNLGADLYIQKPTSFSLLTSILERSLSSIFENKLTNSRNIDFIQKATQ